jgi:hypothetical protein
MRVDMIPDTLSELSRFSSIYKTAKTPSLSYLRVSFDRQSVFVQTIIGNT